MDYTAGRRNKLIEYSLYLGCLLSNISQLPVFVRAGMTQNFAFPGWILLAIAILLSKNIKIHNSAMRQIELGVLLVLWLLIDVLFLRNFSVCIFAWDFFIKLYREKSSWKYKYNLHSNYAFGNRQYIL